MSKISYKTYLNTRLKQVDFHGQLTYPLYIQVTFERRTIFFKSYYFELATKPRFNGITAADNTRSPAMELVVQQEQEVIQYVINTLLPDFSLDAFTKAYTCFSMDLCELTKPAFVNYLRRFFEAREMPYLASLPEYTTRYLETYSLVMDFKKSFTENLYRELIEKSFQEGLLYLQLYGFMLNMPQKNIFILSAMEWQSTATTAAFHEFIEQHYPGIDAAVMIDLINNQVVV